MAKEKLRHGLTRKEILELFRHQEGKCALSGIELELRGEPGAEEVYDPTTGKRISIDHSHETNLIRGLRVQKVNWLVEQWDHGSYGSLSKPPELSAYQENPPAFAVIGKRQFV